MGKTKTGTLAYLSPLSFCWLTAAAALEAALTTQDLRTALAVESGAERHAWCRTVSPLESAACGSHPWLRASSSTMSTDELLLPSAAANMSGVLPSSSLPLGSALWDRSRSAQSRHL